MQLHTLCKSHGQYATAHTQFTFAGQPLDLYEECVATKQYGHALCFLSVIVRTEGLLKARSLARTLAISLKRLVRGGDDGGGGGGSSSNNGGSSKHDGGSSGGDGCSKRNAAEYASLLAQLRRFYAHTKDEARLVTRAAVDADAGWVGFLFEAVFDALGLK